MPRLPDPAHDLFAAAMACWSDGERSDAVRLLRRVVDLDEAHAEAHNHLGMHALEQGEGSIAEQHIRQAIDSGGRDLARDGGRLPWNEPKNRPFLRAHALLAEWFRSELRYADAREIHLQLLRWDPDDALGVRHLLPEEHLRVGALDEAVEAYRQALDEPEGWLGLGFALWRAGEHTAAGHALLHAVGRNRYFAPGVLDEPVTPLAVRLRGCEGLEHAQDYVERCWDLWEVAPGVREFFLALWCTDEVQLWRHELDRIAVALHRLPPGRQQRALVARRAELRSDKQVAALFNLAFSRDFDAASGAFAVHFEVEGATRPSSVDLRLRDASAPTSDRLRRLAAYEDRIVRVATAWDRPERLDSTIACRRRPNRRSCPGHLAVWRDLDGVRWGCTRCSDHGFLHHLEHNPSDLTGRPLRHNARVVEVSRAEHRRLLQLAPIPVQRPALRARWAGERVVIQGSASELLVLGQAAILAGLVGLGVRLLPPAERTID